MRKTLILSLAIGLGLGGIAVAQLIPTLRQATTIGASDLVKIEPNGAPSNVNTYVPARLLAMVKGFYTSVPSTGFTYTFGTNVMRAAFEPTTTLSTGSVTLPSGASDGQEACIYSKSIITTLTLAAASGDTLNDAVTTLAAAGHACYIYGLSNTTWNRTE